MILSDKHLFIVEDNAQNRVIYQMILMRSGALAEFDRWGQDALWHLQGMGHVDLIILDLMLPRGQSGFDIYEKIREMPEYANIPIVAVSAADPSEAIPKAQSMGFAGFIAKPIDEGFFAKQLAQIIAGEQVWDAGDHHESVG
jgi:CheY-like chemotaxis protein